MSISIEHIVRDLLLSEKNIENVVQKLVERLKANEFQGEQNTVAVNFLIHAGYYKEAFQVWEHFTQNSIFYNIMPVCFLLSRFDFEPNGEFFKFLFSAIAENSHAYPFTHFQIWEKQEPRLQKIRDNTIDAWSAAQKKRKAQMLEKLEYFNSNRMIEEEDKLLKELLSLYPEDSSLQLRRERIENQWAHDIVAKKSFSEYAYIDLNTEISISEDEKIAMSDSAKKAIGLVKKNPKLAYNIAIGLYFLEMYKEALSIIKFAHSTLNLDRLNIELLLRARHYVECLDELTRIEKKYANDPETTFSATYCRALALAGLGQTAMAKDLIKTIVDIRPNYRSAHSLLMKWRDPT